MESPRPMDDLRLDVMRVTGLNNVYIDPPSRLEYPCVLISKSSGFTNFADNKAYLHSRSYELQLIDPDPDSIYYDKLVFGLPGVRVNRPFTADNLHHYNFILYY